MFNYSGLFGSAVVEEDDITQGVAAPKFSDRWKWFSIIAVSYTHLTLPTTPYV